MSRLRTTLSTSPIDRAVQGQVTVAERAVTGALRALAGVKRGDEMYPPAHVSRVRRDLERALGALQGIRRVSPAYDVSDPDLLPTAPYERPVPVPVEEVPEEVVVEEAPVVGGS